MRDPIAIFVLIGLLVTLAVSVWAGMELNGCTYVGVSDIIVCSEGYSVRGTVS